MRLKLVSIVAILAGGIYLISAWILSLPKILDSDYSDLSFSADLGEEVFWGKGRCHVCHRIGDRGYALRGPNLGESSEGPLIAIRAQSRARALKLKSGLDYLVQSVIDPGAFLVPKYKDEMPKAFEAPIALAPGEIKSVVIYLQSLGGDTSATEIEFPREFLASFSTSKRLPVFEITGDADTGRDLFFDVAGPAGCAACHAATNSAGVREGGTSGPDLTAIGSFRTARHIYEKITRPDSNVVSGYEQLLVRTLDKQLYFGVIESENDDTLLLRTQNDGALEISKRQIEARVVQQGTAMPTNYADLLKPEQLDDLITYLVKLKGTSPP